MKARTRKLLIGLIGILLAGVLFVPLPLQPNAKDKERAVSHAINAVLKDRRVRMQIGFQRLEEATFMHKQKQICYRNDLGIPDAVFLKYGLKPAPGNQPVNFENSGVISFSDRDVRGKISGNIQFAYGFGSMGGHGYEIRIRKSILMRYFSYKHTWVS